MNNSYIATVILFGVLGASFYYISNHANKVHENLDKIYKDATQENDVNKLRELRTKLIDYHSKECYHRILGERARQILMYIDGKLDQKR